MNTAQVLSLPSPQLALAAITSCGRVAPAGHFLVALLGHGSHTKQKGKRTQAGSAPWALLASGCPGRCGGLSSNPSREDHSQCLSPDTAQFPWGKGPLGRDPALEDTDAVLPS